MLAFLQSQPIENLYIIAVSLVEIRFGVELVWEPNPRAKLTDGLTHKVRRMFEDRTLPISEDVIVTWRLMVEEGRKRRLIPILTDQNA